MQELNLVEETEPTPIIEEEEPNEEPREAEPEKKSELKPIPATVGRDGLRKGHKFDARTDPNRLIYLSVIDRREGGAQRILTELLEKIGYRPVWKPEKDLQVKPKESEEESED